MVAYKQDIV